MAITPRGANTASTNAGTSVSVTIPANVEVGDLLLVGIGHRAGSAGTITAPAGWTQLNGQLNSSTVLAAAIFQRIAEAGDAGSSVTFDSGSGSNTKITAIAQAYGHVDQANPINGSGGQVNASSVNIVAPAITAPNPSLIVNFASTATGTTIGETSGWSQSGAVSTGGGAAGSRNTSAQQSRDWSAANPGSVTAVASAAAVNIGVQIALAEAAAVDHETTGALTGPGSTVAGSAACAAGTVTHATDGALSGSGSGVAGTASRTRVHAIAGALIGSDSVISASAARFRHLTTAGSIIGPGSELIGAANRIRLHDTTGALPGSSATIVGAADRTGSVVDHVTNGALLGSGAVIVGGASRLRSFLTSGVIVGSGAILDGAANRTRLHDASGVIVGSGALITGATERSTGVTVHATSGILVGSGAAIAGDASRVRHFATSGILVGSGSEIDGLVVRTAGPILHDASGDIIGSGSGVDGGATRVIPAVLHDASGDIVGVGAAVGGDANRAKISITVAEAQRLYHIYMLHGLKLGKPLVVSKTARSAGGVEQTVSDSGGIVNIETTAAPDVDLPDVGVMIDELAALYGLNGALSVSTTSRIGVGVDQQISSAGGITTVARS